MHDKRTRLDKNAKLREVGEREENSKVGENTNVGENMNIGEKAENEQGAEIKQGGVSSRRPGPRRPLSRHRLWAFRFVLLVALPLLLLFSAEWMLRLAGYGFPDTAAIECVVDGKKAYCDNVRFTRLFFPPSLAREFDPFRFFAERPEKTYRIFVLGASAAQGFPAGEYAFGRILEVMLEHWYPGTDFEVINVAAVAINSHAVLKIARECAGYDPGLFIVYLGNNEVVGPYGAGTVFSSLVSNLTMIRLQLAIAGLRIGQWLCNLIQPALEENRPRVWRGMEMFLDHQVRHDAPDLETVYHHFEQNLCDIRDAAVDAGIKTVFCTVCTNLRDSPPFASLHDEGLSGSDLEQWDSLYAEGIAFETTGRFDEAVESYLAAAKIDDSYADLQFRLARCQSALSHTREAHDAYLLAREYDTLRFRADRKINDIIRAVAGEKASEGIYLVDTARIFEDACKDHAPGKEWFYEHVHLNFSGNYLLARSLFDAIDSFLPESVTHSREARDGNEAHDGKEEQDGNEAQGEVCPNEKQCRRILACTPWDRFSLLNQVLETLLKRPPFSHRLYHDQNLAFHEKELDSLKAQLNPVGLQDIRSWYDQAIRTWPGDWWLHWKFARFLNMGLNDAAASLKEYCWVREHLPHSYRVQSQYGLMLAKLGKTDEAIAVNRLALELNPLCADAHYSLGLCYMRMDRMDDAVAQYQKAIEIKPNHIESYSNLGILLFQQGRAREGIEVCREGLAFAPTDLHLLFNLAVMLEKEGRLKEASEEVADLLALYPDFQAARQLADAFAVERGDRE